MSPPSPPARAIAWHLDGKRALLVQLLLIVAITALLHFSWAACRQYGAGLMWMAPLGWALYGFVSIAGPFGGASVETVVWASGWASAAVGFAGWILGLASRRQWLMWLGMLGVAVFFGFAYGFLCLAMSA